MARLCLLLALLAALFGAAGGAWGQVPVPPLARPVTDLTGTLSPAQIDAIEARLLAFEQRKGSQVAVLMVPTTQPEAIEQFSLRVAEQWKIGRKKIDDGAILVIAKDDHAVRIEVGYGIEGVLNDATSKRIIEERIIPRLRDGDFNGGIADGIDAILNTVEGEPLPAVDRQGQIGMDDGFRLLLPLALVVALVLGSVLRALLGRVGGAAATGGVIGLAAWLMAGAVGIALLAGVIGFVFTLVGGGRRGWGAMMMGAGGRGSGWGGGGGWSGGGGGFGGGGASGRW